MKPEEILSIPSATVSIEWLLEVKHLLENCSPSSDLDYAEAQEKAKNIDSILSNYKL